MEILIIVASFVVVTLFCIVFFVRRRERVLKSRTKVLLLDDDAASLKLVQTTFERNKFQVITALQASEAMALIESDPPDLVLVDIVEPEKDGFAFCSELRQRQHTANLPIIMITDDSRRDSKLTALQMGVDDYLTRPFDPEELLARARALLRRSHDSFHPANL
ncbi:MAG: response regulator [Candidatus Tectomicrobia bacterium]|nr:response regulator [Candidatus Tectomicrobia bacterium]